MHDWVLGTPAGKFVSMAVDSTGNSYGIADVSASTLNTQKCPTSPTKEPCGTLTEPDMCTAYKEPYELADVSAST
jgi:hypothetical protein